VSKTIAFILAGGIGKRLSLLTRFRAKPAVPFAGRYRIIDFTLTNCVRSGIDEVYILTQYISRSLTHHLGIGKPWDLDRISGGLHILHPHLGYQAADWYQGTADAFFQNIPMLKDLYCDRVLILSGDHVYRADYRQFIDFYERAGKPAAVGVVEVPISFCQEFGIATVDGNGTIVKFEEKPERSTSNLASMGIYIFKKDFLISTVQKLKKLHQDLDFGKHIIPYLVRRGKISAFRFKGYWLDIGTLKGYYKASLALLADKPRLRLYESVAPVLTVPDDYPPLVVAQGARIQRSLICKGCTIEGEVSSSILSPGVTVEKGARVKNSIIFHDCSIGKDANIENVIIDKMVVIGRGTKIGFGNAHIPSRLQPSYIDFGITLIGRKTKIPPGIAIGTNCLVCGSREGGSIPRKNIEDGDYYIAEDLQS